MNETKIKTGTFKYVNVYGTNDKDSITMTIDGVKYAVPIDEAPANGTNNIYVIHRVGNNDSMTIQSGISATLADATISGTLTVSSGTLTVSGSGSKVNFSNLPTSDPGVAGQLYRDSGTVKVSV